MKDSTLEQLRRISYGTLLKIRWLDAATVRSASLNRLPFPNYYVETRRTTVGSYVCLQQGQAQRAWHLILEMDNTEGSGSTIRSIPLCLIYKVEVSRKTAEESGARMVKGRRVAVGRERGLIELRDGSVKLLESAKAA